MLSLKVIFCILVDIRLLNWFNASSYRVLVVVDNCEVSFEGVVMQSNMTPKITAALLKVRIGYPYSLRNNLVYLSGHLTADHQGQLESVHIQGTGIDIISV